MSKSLLVTGANGQLGSELSQLAPLYPEFNFTFVTRAELDLTNTESIHLWFADKTFDVIINCAAYTAVDKAESEPDVAKAINTLAVEALATIAKEQSCSLIHVSTDYVFAGKNHQPYQESEPTAPQGVYGQSKLAGEQALLAINPPKSVLIRTAWVYSSFNYGPKQHNEKLIPTIIRKAIGGELIPIYGDGKNIRDWLYVLDHCKGIDLVYHKGNVGEVYNIGGRNERTNNYIADKVCEILDSLRPKAAGSYKDQLNFVEDRAGHDKRYAIDASKIESELGWQADENFETGIVKTIEGYLSR